MKRISQLLALLLFAAPVLSPAQTFTNALAIPPTLTGPAFSLTVKDSTKTFLPGLPSATISLNNMDYMGPTLIFNRDETVSFDIENAMNADSITVHWHGFHVPAQWDGGPMSAFGPGETWSPTFKVMEHASTMWYHSHRHEETTVQVVRGLAGLIIIRDTIESQLNLPRTYGVDDIPLIIQDKVINPQNGTIEPAFLGDTMMVNGTLNAFVECPAQVVRFRLLNASVERAYMLGFDDNRSFYQIGTDGGLLEAPVSMNRLALAPGERAELLLDFTGESAGTDLFLRSYSTEFLGEVAGSCNNGPGCGVGPLDSTDFSILRMRITAPTGGAVTSIPGSLVSIDWLDEGAVDTTRIKTLQNPAAPGEPFTIDGQVFDMGVINDIVPLGNTEIWRFENHSQIAHPMHIHDVQFNVLRINGAAPPANHRGWKDVVFVYPGDTVEVLAEFTDFADPMYTYMMHCHSLSHEDNGMMEQFLVIDMGTGVDEGAEQAVKLYPNPAGDHLRIELPERAGRLEIYDMQGRMRYGGNLTSGCKALDLQDYEAGMYFGLWTASGKAARAFRFVRQ